MCVNDSRASQVGNYVALLSRCPGIPHSQPEVLFFANYLLHLDNSSYTIHIRLYLSKTACHYLKNPLHSGFRFKLRSPSHTQVVWIFAYFRIFLHFFLTLCGAAVYFPYQWLICDVAICAFMYERTNPHTKCSLRLISWTHKFISENRSKVGAFTLQTPPRKELKYKSRTLTNDAC